MDIFQDAKAEMAILITVPVGMYLRDMKTNGTYADHIILQALSDMLGITIRVVHADTADVALNPNDSTASQLLLGYLPHIQHYVSLEPRY
ncbi:hypothetical protein DPMN_154618 [Dreissena polymorpha]|uniref:OTU domain-containing protein n=1 Tax=Dreissena polymorpha TaxID=45954 RepID=A0A9D4J998_DREPO|nr:hypothetical protein DPMN_154618 [Dreissena polymorpha]